MGSWPSTASRARLRRSTGHAVQSVRPACTAAPAWSMRAMVAGPAMCSAAALSASVYIAAARCSRVTGSVSAAWAVCAEIWLASRRRTAERMSTAVGGWVALGARMRCGSASAVEK